MTRFWLITGFVGLLLLGLFFGFEVINLEVLSNPNALMNTSTLGVAILGMVLLILDVFLPIPSSLIMIVNGTLFGFATGMLLSMIGTVGAALLGLYIGYLGGPLMDRLMTPEEREQTHRLLEKHGYVAIIATRPIPIIAETTVIMAGAAQLRWWFVALAAALGALPPAAIYALAGSGMNHLNQTPLVFGFVLLLAGLFWVVMTRFGKLDQLMTDNSKISDTGDPSANQL